MTKEVDVLPGENDGEMCDVEGRVLDGCAVVAGD